VYATEVPRCRLSNELGGTTPFTEALQDVVKIVLVTVKSYRFLHQRTLNFNVPATGIDYNFCNLRIGDKDILFRLSQLTRPDCGKISR